jgi:hypothetical protein
MIFIKDNWKRILFCLLPRCLHLYDSSFVEAHFFRRLILKKNTILNFPSRQKFKHDFLPRIVKRTKELFVFPTFESCNICIVFFDLWMSRGGVYTFVLIIHFLNDN